MNYKIFTVPTTRYGDDEAELDAFLGGHRDVLDLFETLLSSQRDGLILLQRWLR